ncbi:MAG: alkaline phosphatase D family protein [Acidiferrobacterales bacterium]|nr:alkaline phosphatase D family protein [Acidiferrobacterales bacterium]
MKNKIPRRTALGIIGTGVLTACGANKNSKIDNGIELGGTQFGERSEIPSSHLSSEQIYQHGVASGDPTSESVVLWTRISISQPEATSSESRPLRVKWQLALDVEFSNIVKSSDVDTDSSKDFTVKAYPENLAAGQTFYYRFEFNGVYSQIGRTKTLPSGSIDRYCIALASCSNYAFGYFNAYDAIANDPDIDLVLHTGDYIYEYGAKEWGSETAEKLNRVHEPSHEIITLNDYRQRHAQYKSDAGSRAMHAAHPFICCWDDHESTNNPWLNGAQNHQPDSEGDWQQRRTDSIQAYYEWMPIRDPLTKSAREAFTRSYVIGDLASLVTLETRHTARAEQIDYLSYYDAGANLDVSDLKENVIGASGRRMISADTEKMIKTTFQTSKAKGQLWRLIGNPSPIAKMLVPDVLSLGVLDDADQSQLETYAAKSIIWKGQHNLPFYTDTWDGYPWARERLYNLCRNVGAQDAIFLTGDSHSFWINKLADDNGQAAGIELGTAGISSPGDFVESGWDKNTAYKLDRVFEEQLDEVIWTDNFHQGYVKLQLTKENAKASFVAVSTVLTPNYETKVIKTALIEHIEDSVGFVT